MPEIVTVSELSRRMGIDAAVVARAAQADRLVQAPDGSGYLADESIARYRATQDEGPIGQAQRERWDRARSGALVDAQSGEVLRLARAQRAIHDAEIARITRERMEGELAETASIRNAGERIGIAFRTRFENLPDQLAPQLAAETDVERVHALLVEAIEQALADTSRDVRQWVDQLRSGKTPPRAV